MTDLFNEKANDWDVNDMVKNLSRATGSAILKNIDFKPQMSVMDFGAGTGLVSAHVAPLVNKITAVDISASMLKKLAEKPELQGKVEICCQDITETPIKTEFDVIISAMAMHHIDDTQKLMQVFCQHLKPGGKLALADLDKEDGSFHPADVQGVFHYGFERDELQKIMAANGFKEIQFVTAHTVNKEAKQYPIFLVTATKA